MSISFGRDVLRPSLTRRPTFNGFVQQTATYAFRCVACDAIVHLDLLGIRGRDGRASILGAEHAGEILEHFGIGIVGKAHDGGWPRFAVESCAQCATRYLIYIDCQEPRNSVDVLTMQGIVELCSDAPRA